LSQGLLAGASKPRARERGDHTVILNVGVSRAGICGVRDYAHVLADALHDLGIHVDTQWLDTEASWGPSRARAETRRWLDAVRERVALIRPTWILWHYSVFSYTHRGIPTLSRLTASGLAAAGPPIVGILHELAYPFGPRGIRGLTLGLAQRAVLPSVYGRLAAAVVTTEDRVEWLEHGPWLPRRPVTFVPVCANVTFPEPPIGTARSAEPVVGIVGFASESYLVEPVLEAVRLVDESTSVRLLLIGAPGSESAQARRWREVAARLCLEDRLSFTGVLEPNAYAAAIASVDVVLFPDADGPSSRKTTLAAALAAGRPIVAIDGPGRWDLLAAEKAVLLVRPDPRSIADALGRFCQDPALQDDQGRRGETFYRRHQAPDVVARRLLEFLSEQSSDG
jgi:glycosyltransferase involved in cell wall biosynthesis